MVQNYAISHRQIVSPSPVILADVAAVNDVLPLGMSSNQNFVLYQRLLQDRQSRGDVSQAKVTDAPTSKFTWHGLSVYLVHRDLSFLLTNTLRMMQRDKVRTPVPSSCSPLLVSQVPLDFLSGSPSFILVFISSFHFKLLF